MDIIQPVPNAQQIRSTPTEGLLRIMTTGLPLRLEAAFAEEDNEELDNIMEVWNTVAKELKRRDWSQPRFRRYHSPA